MSIFIYIKGARAADFYLFSRLIDAFTTLLFPLLYVNRTNYFREQIWDISGALAYFLFVPSIIAVSLATASFTAPPTN